MVTKKKTGTVDGGAGRGVRIGGRDERPPTGYDPKHIAGGDAVIDDDETLPEIDDAGVEDFFEDDDEADRRRDPLRRPGTN